jgi:FkbM family methyltransferase
MGANSLPRRVLKRVLAPLLPEPAYRIVQAVAMGWDIRSGAFTEPELDLISYGVRPGETAIDIGANYGLYSYHFSRAVGPSGKVYAFEPVPFTAKTFKLIGTALRFNNVTLFEKGCGDKPGKLRFRVPIAESGSIMAGVVHLAARDNERDGRQQHARFERSKEIECDIVTLDDVIPNDQRTVSFIKCDIEGADYFALKGAAKIIEKHKPTVVSEINPWFVEGFGLTVEQLVSFFTDQGYKLYRYENKQLIETPIEKVVEDNWVFVHPSRMDRFRSILAPSA